MSTVELPAGVHHGTPEGYAAGCNKDRKDCPALAEHGMSCTIAYVRSMTDVRYFKAKTRDPRAAAIARYLGIHPPTSADLEADIRRDHLRIEGTPMPKPPKAPNPRAKNKPTPAAPTHAAPGDGTPARATLTMADFTRGLSQSATRERGREIRAWLRAHGYPGLADRGIVPPSALYAYLLEHPGATDPAQPLAEQSHDPRGNTPAPADGAAAAPAKSTAAEGENMGHPDHAPATEELIDQVRDRIDMPKPPPPAIPGLLTPEEARAAAGIQTPAPQIPPAEPVGQTLADAPGPRPEWATVTTSNEVTAALADRDTALEQRDQARSLAARLWEQLDATEERARTAETALELTLTRWDTATTALAAARRANRFLFKRLITREAELRASLDVRIRIARAAAAAAAAGWNFEPATNDAENAPPVRHLDDEAVHVALTPTRRGILPWKKHTR